MMSLDRQEEPVDSDGRGPLSQDMINLIDEHSLMVSVSPSANAQRQDTREREAPCPLRCGCQRTFQSGEEPNVQVYFSCPSLIDICFELILT
jgi:hypothetical protein